MKQLRYTVMKRYSLLIVAMMVFASCEKFLDVKPKKKFIPEFIQDYEDLSSNPSYSTNSNAFLEELSDNIYLSDAQVKSSFARATTKGYKWLPEFYLSTETDTGWDPMYNNIFNANVIIEEVSKLKDGTEKQRMEVLGDAYFNRAYAYWNLVNEYAKDYDAKTAETDLGIPLIVIPDLEAKPTRATVAAVYGLILQDLLKAKDQLPDEAKNLYRNNKTAAFALLARVYQSMDNYPEAKKYANMALALKSTLFDYSTMSFINPAIPLTGINNKPVINKHPEMISYKETGFGTILTNHAISQDFFDLLGEKDLRYVFNFTTLDRKGNPNPDLARLYIPSALNYNIGVPEMMLISAEAEARAQQIAPALQLLNDLRKKRFYSADYKDLTAATPDEALKLVIDERRRELFGKGLRWFDMKRLDSDNRFRKSYVRANTDGIYKLEAGSNIFVQQIPGNVRLLNPGIIPNPR
ncbi:RagB/SusD family nutrient uptake outer membrane protein [Pedobacter sp. ASV1-7]|uniref:RagB/SusD family nutrient uptake outer membrane protein n=1 Tax=Pedobacter sp. ASV1-7 TaxID=3145237 RepID=UPI0032E8A294